MAVRGAGCRLLAIDAGLWWLAAAACSGTSAPPGCCTASVPAAASRMLRAARRALASWSPCCSSASSLWEQRVGPVAVRGEPAWALGAPLRRTRVACGGAALTLRRSGYNARPSSAGSPMKNVLSSFRARARSPSACSRSWQRNDRGRRSRPSPRRPRCWATTCGSWCSDGPGRAAQRNRVRSSRRCWSPASPRGAAGKQLGGRHPDVVCGHSLGEYTALVAAGALAFPAVVELVRERAPTDAGRPCRWARARWPPSWGSTTQPVVAACA